MDDIVTAVKHRMDELRSLMRRAKIDPRKNIEGSLRLTHSKQYIRYYQHTANGCRYLKKSETETAIRLADQDYRRELQKRIKTEMSLLEHFARTYQRADALELLLSYHEGRRSLISPIVLPDEMFIEEWKRSMEERTRDGTNDYIKQNVFVTDQGESVRSKSELILANMFFRRKIPYYYELPLKLGRTVVYPDFTLLNVRTRKTLYWEHEGMLTDTEYAAQVIRKHCLYEKNEIYENETLLVSRESVSVPLDLALVEQKIDRFLL